MKKNKNIKRFIFISLLVHFILISVLALIFKSEAKVAISGFFEVSTVKLASNKGLTKKIPQPGPVTASLAKTNIESVKPANKSKIKPKVKKKTVILQRPAVENIKEAQNISENKTEQAEYSDTKVADKPVLTPGSITRDAYPDYSANPKPAYPLIARRRGYEGTVLLKVLVLENGKVGKVNIERSSAHKILDTAAVSAVNKWSFIPGRKNGSVLASWVKIPIKFELNDS
ncbi:MAG: energy transducer TonB [Candidatus Dadabacteria bacterium]|nr:energy transducer TonB [Candidatus Dadabacteria bacterium]NIS08031.1 energy transducer TonB [Candidatus Dadabacteria bacterium]NIV40854.1 TonB family protein [Candidatus Dadabacteria bacterium]NIY21609.1 TonB family protein [Candidatus Dadabacteria bacterium]